MFSHLEKKRREKTDSMKCEMQDMGEKFGYFNPTDQEAKFQKSYLKKVEGKKYSFKSCHSFLDSASATSDNQQTPKSRTLEQNENEIKADLDPLYQPHIRKKSNLK